MLEQDCKQALQIPEALHIKKKVPTLIKLISNSVLMYSNVFRYCCHNQNLIFFKYTSTNKTLYCTFTTYCNVCICIHFSLYIYIYIYICVCVCVDMFVCISTSSSLSSSSSHAASTDFPGTFAIRLYHPSLPASLLHCILCPYIAVLDKFLIQTIYIYIYIYSYHHYIYYII